jgi:hypothetical protein
LGASTLLSCWARSALAQEPTGEDFQVGTKAEGSAEAPAAPAAPAPEGAEAAPKPDAAPPEKAAASETPKAEAPKEEPVLTEGTDADVVPPPKEDVTPEPPFEPKLSVGMGIRTGLALTFDDPATESTTLKLNDGVGGSMLNVRPYFSGSLTPNVGFTGNFETTESGVALLDAIAQIKVVDEMQIWVGQHIPAMERNNFNGPFYTNGWTLPIHVQTMPFDIAARDRGATVWGLVAGGVFKYHVSVVDLAPPAGSDLDGDGVVDTKAASMENARLALRANFNLLDPENYYYTSGTYYGEQETLAIGGVLHTQRGVDAVDGSDLDNDLLAYSLDLLYENKASSAGTFTLEGGYWNFEETGANYRPNQGTTDFGTGAVGPIGGTSYLVGVSWLTPEKIGYGKVQPLVKIQIGDYEPAKVTVVDAGIGYVVDGFNHRYSLNYRRIDVDDGSDPINMLQVGIQLQK